MEVEGNITRVPTLASSLPQLMNDGPKNQPRFFLFVWLVFFFVEMGVQMWFEAGLFPKTPAGA